MCVCGGGGDWGELYSYRAKQSKHHAQAAYASIRIRVSNSPLASQSVSNAARKVTYVSARSFGISIVPCVTRATYYRVPKC